MAFALVSSVIKTHPNDGSGANAFDTSDVPIDTTGANLIVTSVSCLQFHNGGPLVIGDNKSNSYINLTPKLGASVTLAMLSYVTGTPTVGSGHYWTFGPSGLLFGSIAIQAWSGADASAFDAESAGGANSGTTVQPGSLTASAANSLYITSISVDDSATASIDSGFTISDQHNQIPFGGEGIAMAYLVQGAAAAVNPTWTLNASREISSVMATFKAAGGGGGGNPWYYYQQLRQFRKEQQQRERLIERVRRDTILKVA